MSQRSWPLFVTYDIYEVQTLPFYKIIDEIHLHYSLLEQK